MLGVVLAELVTKASTPWLHNAWMSSGRSLACVPCLCRATLCSLQCAISSCKKETLGTAPGGERGGLAEPPGAARQDDQRGGRRCERGGRGGDRLAARAGAGGSPGWTAPGVCNNRCLPLSGLHVLRVACAVPMPLMLLCVQQAGGHASGSAQAALACSALWGRRGGPFSIYEMPGCIPGAPNSLLLYMCACMQRTTLRRLRPAGCLRSCMPR